MSNPGYFFYMVQQGKLATLLSHVPIFFLLLKLMYSTSKLREHNREMSKCPSTGIELLKCCKRT